LAGWGWQVEGGGLPILQLTGPEETPRKVRNQKLPQRAADPLTANVFQQKIREKSSVFKGKRDSRSEELKKKQISEGLRQTI